MDMNGRKNMLTNRLFFSLSCFIFFNACSSGNDKLTDAKYSGRESCQKCHETEQTLFEGSDHDKAMDLANPETVLGDFNNASFTHFGITSKFFRKEEKYIVSTEGADGTIKEFQVKYTFGHWPLQQYLVEFPGGRVQTLPLCWDSRTAEEGGQRWFHIYPDERISADDILFWTRSFQNWNYMCAECHSTNFKKNYNFKTGHYNTSFSEIDVSCEACHGPGSQHIDWAEKKERGEETDSYPDMGLAIRLKDLDQGVWIMDQETGTAKRSIPRKKNAQVEMCARCHSRRSIISEDYQHGKSLLDTHIPSLLEENLYFADGQIKDEVYVYGSFLQSKMYQAGVVCSDCHEAHSAEVFPCIKCHQATKYDSPEHHFHKAGSTGALCVECHMPERTYMVVDPRRDHSIRIPRPDLSVKMGMPNACNKCHTDQSAEWAASYLKKWYGLPDPNQKHYGEIFWAARQGDPQAQKGLRQLAADKNQSPIIRATAISLLGNYPGQLSLQAIQKSVQDSDPQIRVTSINVFNFLRPDDRVDILTPLLQDTVRLVRIQAALSLAEVSGKNFSAENLLNREQALDEYIQAQNINADNPSAHLNLGLLHLMRGALKEAESSFNKAIEIEPGYMPGHLNLADLYRLQKREKESENVLLKAIKINSDVAYLHHAFGLLLIRTRQKEKALTSLANAVQLEPRHVRYSYVYATALNENGKPEQAISLLNKTLEHNPFNQDLLFALSVFNRDIHKIDMALVYAEKLVEYYPENRGFKQLKSLLQNLQIQNNTIQ